MEAIRLSNGRLYIEFDQLHGAIQAIGDTSRSISLVQEPRLAENYRILLPLPERRGHYIMGKDQMLSSYHLTDEECVLVWDSLSSAAGAFDIRVKMRVRLQEDTFTFQITVENQTDHVVEETIYPTVGGLSNFGEAQDWLLHSVNWAGKGNEWPLYKVFPGSYLGPEYPLWTKNYESLPWIDVYDKQRGCGVYFGIHDEVPRHSTAYAQLIPGVNNRSNANESRWPSPTDLAGTPIGMMLGWATFPFVKPGTTHEGSDIVIHFHDGNWHEAADYYRSWYDAHTNVPKERSWLSAEDAWQSTIISYPEDSIMFRFNDLPKLAQAALRAGIRVLQIDGWDIGGIDRGYPKYEPDPRLGTPEELAAAIKHCQSMGVRVLLFANLQWANVETDWFQTELKHYAVRDPRGLIKNSMGWEYNTTLGLNGDCESRMVLMNPAHHGYQETILNQLNQIVELGADGIQLDKMGSGADAGFHGCIDYHPNFADRRDRSIKQGVLDTIEKFRSAALESKPGFAIASESHWDRVVPYVDASYSRFFEGDHVPTFRYVFPEYRQTCCITGPTDFGLVNLAIQYGYIINIEGRYLHGTLDDLPALSPYVKEVLKLRRRHLDVLWNSRLIHLAYAGIRVNGDVSCCAHRSISDPSRFALVLTNQHDESVNVIVGVENATEIFIEQPFSTPKKLEDGSLSLPPHRFAVLLWTQQA